MEYFFYTSIYFLICIYLFFFCQISYNLTGSLTKNKDSLPQNLLFTIKCKYPMNNRHACTLWCQHALHYKDALLCKQTAHKTTRCPNVVVFLYVRFIPCAADSTVCVYIVYRKCQM